MFNFILFAIQLAISIYFMYQARKQEKETLKAATLDDFSFPTADETRALPYGYGTFEISGPNVLWYGDYSTFTIYQKVKSGGFFGLFQNTDKVNAGFGYKLGLHFGLCWGGLNKTADLKAIKIDNKYIYNTNSSGSFSGNIDNQTFFGEYENGPGGIQGNFSFYAGNEQQTSDPYLVNQLGNNVPYYNNLCHLVWKNGYIGNNNSLAPWSFIIKRIVKPFWSVQSPTDYNEINGGANPACVIYDILTDKFYGLGLSENSIDISNFYDSHITLKNEGLGMSFLVQDAKTVEDVINDVLKYIDGQLNFDFNTGRIQIKLNRADYNIDLLPEFNESNIIRLENFSRGSLTSLINEVKIKWTDINDNFKQKLAPFYNQGGRFERDRSETTIIDFSFINSEDVAQRIAKREAVPLMTPLLKCDITVNRKAYNIKPGDVLKLSWPKLSINQIVMRVLEVDYGSLKNSQIRLSLIQDKFSIDQYSVYANSPSNNWSDIDYSVKNADLIIEEAPYYFTNETDLKNKVLTFAKKPSSSHINYDLYSKVGSNNYIINGVSNGFCPVGQFNSSIDELSNSITLINESDMSIITSETDDRIAAGFNIALIIEGSKKEFINFKTISFNSGVYTISNINRALLDTIPQKFTSAAKIYFFSYGFALNNNETFEDNSVVNLKALTRTSKEVMTLANATEYVFNISNRVDKPIVVSNLIINNNNYKEVINIGQVNLLLSYSNRDRKTSLQYYNQNTITNNDNNLFNIKIYDNTTNTLLKNETITEMSYEFVDEQSLNSGLYFNQLRVEIETVNETIASIYKYVIIVNRT